MPTFLDHVVKTGTYDHGRLPITYRVISKDYAPSYPFFAGCQEDMLFVSEEVPEQWRDYVLFHEATCMIDRRHQPGGCVRTTREEIELVPQADRLAYIEMRCQFYEALLEQQPNHPLKDNIESSLRFLRSLDWTPQSTGWPAFSFCPIDKIYA